MKKDIQNVVITFSLVALMLYGGSFFYTKKVLAEEVALRAEEERLVKEFEAQALMQAQLLKINAEQERLLAEQKHEAEQKELEAKEIAQAKAKAYVQPVVATVPKSTTPTNTAKAQVAGATQQAQIQAQADTQAKAQADALSAQIAAAKVAAEKIAQQKADAAAEVAAAKASRKSRAS